MNDYYKILGISNNASDADIKKAYYRLALRYHPDKNDSPQAEQQFQEIVRAYNVLGHKNKRFVYDIYQERCELRNRNHANENEEFYDSTNDRRDKTFLKNILKFFGLTVKKNNHRFHMYGRTNDKQMPVKEPSIKRNIFVTLNELYYGITKIIKISRVAYGGVRHEEKTFEFKIRPGMKNGTQIIFPREGDRLPGTLPADIIFVIREKPHPIFKRCGNDIKFKTDIYLNQALCGNFALNIPTLENKTIKLVVKNEIIRPSTIKRITGKGLPDSKDPTKYGDLLIEFNIKFPDKVLPKAKKIIAKTLKD